MRRFAMQCLVLAGLVLGFLPRPATSQTTDAEIETIKAVIRLIFEQGFNQRNAQIYETFLAPDHVLHALLEQDLIGPAAANLYFTTTLDIFPDFAFVVQQVIAEGDVFAVRWTASGTQEGVFGGIPPTGLKVEFVGLTMGRFTQTLVTETWHHRNRLGLLEQIGFVPLGLVPVPPGHTGGAPGLVPGATGDTDREQIRTAVRRLFEEGFNQRNTAVLEEILAPEHVLHQPDGDFVGPQDLRLLMELLWTLSPDLRISLDALAVDGDTWSALWTVRGSHLGEFDGVPQTGNQIEVGGATIGRFADGRAIETWSYPDQIKALQQVGILPDPVLPRPFLELDTHIGVTSWGLIKRQR